MWILSYWTYQMLEFNTSSIEQKYLTPSKSPSRSLCWCSILHHHFFNPMKSWWVRWFSTGVSPQSRQDWHLSNLTKKHARTGTMILTPEKTTIAGASSPSCQLLTHAIFQYVLTVRLCQIPTSSMVPLSFSWLNRTAILITKFFCFKGWIAMLMIALTILNGWIPDLLVFQVQLLSRNQLAGVCAQTPTPNVQFRHKSLDFN